MGWMYPSRATLQQAQGAPARLNGTVEQVCQCGSAHYFLKRRTKTDYFLPL